MKQDPSRDSPIPDDRVIKRLLHSMAAVMAANEAPTEAVERLGSAKHAIC